MNQTNKTIIIIILLLLMKIFASCNSADKKQEDLFYPLYSQMFQYTFFSHFERGMHLDSARTAPYRNKAYRITSLIDSAYQRRILIQDFNAAFDSLALLVQQEVTFEPTNKLLLNNYNEEIHEIKSMTTEEEFIVALIKLKYSSVKLIMKLISGSNCWEGWPSLTLHRTYEKDSIMLQIYPEYDLSRSPLDFEILTLLKDGKDVRDSAVVSKLVSVFTVKIPDTARGDIEFVVHARKGYNRHFFEPDTLRFVVSSKPDYQGPFGPSRD